MRRVKMKEEHNKEEVRRWTELRTWPGVIYEVRTHYRSWLSVTIVTELQRAHSGGMYQKLTPPRRSGTLGRLCMSQTSNPKVYRCNINGRSHYWDARSWAENHSHRRVTTRYSHCICTHTLTCAQLWDVIKIQLFNLETSKLTSNIVSAMLIAEAHHCAREKSSETALLAGNWQGGGSNRKKGSKLKLDAIPTRRGIGLAGVLNGKKMRKWMVQV